MNSAETNPQERGLGKPCAGKPPARFDEGEGSVPGDRFATLSTLQPLFNGSRQPSRLRQRLDRLPPQNYAGGGYVDGFCRVCVVGFG